MVKRKGSFRKKRTTTIGEYLTNIRVEHGKTQQEIAATIGRSRSCICKIETGARTQKSLRGILLLDLAKAYGASIAKILEEADWPQLPLLDTTEEERQELQRHLNRIRKKKRQEESQAKK